MLPRKLERKNSHVSRTPPDDRPSFLTASLPCSRQPSIGPSFAHCQCVARMVVSIYGVPCVREAWDAHFVHVSSYKPSSIGSIVDMKSVYFCAYFLIISSAIWSAAGGHDDGVTTSKYPDSCAPQHCHSRFELLA